MNKIRAAAWKVADTHLSLAGQATSALNRVDSGFLVQESARVGIASDPLENTLEQLIPCRFCSSPAVGIFYLDKGCACYPDERTQALCAQHIDKATPLGSMELIAKPPGVQLTLPNDSVNALEVRIRIVNALRNEEIKTIIEVEHLTDKELLKIPNFGKKSLKELRGAVTEWRKEHPISQPSLWPNDLPASREHS